MYSHPLKDLRGLLVLHEDVVDAGLKDNEVIRLALPTCVRQLLLQQRVQCIQHTGTTEPCNAVETSGI